ncbi:MAG: hypothetical protein ED559_04705 [Phycisphaera sp.]|nr:MAG: hypothetical protein ED559_04705 [Phycisphaera sp.]
MQSTAALILASIAAASASAQPSDIPVQYDYMSSGFFQSDYLRGDEANSTRGVNRATSPTIFGVTGETSYFGFDFDPAQFSGPVQSASFQVEVVANGFFGDPSPANPADISIHSLSADPLVAIDENIASGPGSWVEFRNNEITTSSIVSTSTVDNLGVFSWDITDLVNEWIANGDTNFAYTIGTSALLDTNPETAIGFVNSSAASLDPGAFTARIVIPTPASGVIALTGGIMALRRRRR